MSKLHPNGTEVGNLLRHIESGIMNFFNGDSKTETIIKELTAFMLQVKTAVNNKEVINIAKMIPDGIGIVTLDKITEILNSSLKTTEIVSKVVYQIKPAIAGKTDTAEIVNIVLPIIITAINNLNPNHQDKHIEEIIVTVLKNILNIPIKEIELLVKSEMLKLTPATTA